MENNIPMGISLPKEVPMGQETIEFGADTSICEAVGCEAKATIVIKVKVGEQGMITLLLCKNCINKFVGDHLD
jgi:hypothetical protein